MKTSNKILLGLLIATFVIPLLLAYTLKSKVRKGEYTIEKYKNSGNDGSERSGSFTAFKVLKIVAPGPDYLTCHLRQSGNLHYNYYLPKGSDSITVFTSNDTLFVKYVAQKNVSGENESARMDNLSIEVDLHAFSNLIVDGAEVIMDSIAASPGNLNVTLKNHAVIKDGSKNNREVIQGDPTGRRIKKKEVTKRAEIAEVSIKDTADDKIRKAKEKTSVQVLDVAVKDLLIFHLI